MTASTDLDDTLANIRARAEAATPGPWEAFDANKGDGTYRPGWMVANDAFHNPPADPDAPWIAVELHVGTRHDAEFIAHARADIDLLLNVVADLRSRIGCVVEATYWDSGYDVRIAAIRGMCDLTTDGMTPKEAGR